MTKFENIKDLLIEFVCYIPLYGHGVTSYSVFETAQYNLKVLHGHNLSSVQVATQNIFDTDL